jgi:hypothetical protein
MQEVDKVQATQATLELAVEQKVHERTFRRVRNLRVELIHGQIVIHGSARSYYVKLLALEAARQVLASTCPLPLSVDIQVT